MFFEPTSLQEVSNIIHSLKPKNSSGYDDSSNKLLKELHPVILKPFTEVINRSLKEGIFPNDMNDLIRSLFINVRRNILQPITDLSRCY